MSQQITHQSEALFKRAQRVSPGGVHSPVRAFRGVGGVPRFIQSAQGAELIDVDGNRYIDFCLSWGPLILGHQDKEVTEAVHQALSRGWTYGTVEPYSLELAEFITTHIPWIEKIRFVNSGTEAVMAALRLARAATGREKILKFEGCYHGHCDSMMVRAGSGLAEMACADSAGIPENTIADTIICPLNDPLALEEIFSKHGSDLAAVIIEAIPANYGLLLQTEDFLYHLTKLAHQSGTLVILDEVITGFRVAFGGMAERLRLQPDLVVYGKIIGGGFPVGAYGGRSDLMDLVAPSGPVYQAGTLSANPIAMAAGLITLKRLLHRNPYLSLEAKTEYFASRMEQTSEKLGLSLRVQRFASLFWIVMGQAPREVIRSKDQIPSQQKEHYAKIFHSLLERGFYLAPSGFEVSFLSTAHTEDHLNHFLEAFEESLQW